MFRNHSNNKTFICGIKKQRLLIIIMVIFLLAFIMSLFFQGCSPNLLTYDASKASYDQGAEGDDFGVGYNIPILFADITSDTRAPQEERSTRLEMYKRTLRNAAKSGANHVALFMGSSRPSGQYDIDQGKNDYTLWLSNPTEYWNRIEDIFNYIDSQGLKIIVRGWAEERTFPTLASYLYNVHETTRDFITNPNSKSFLLYERYLREFLERFGNKPYLIAIGISNELNLIVELDQKKRCLANNAKYGNEEERCTYAGSFSTDEMIGFSFRVVQNIFKKYAPRLKTLSGFSLPRESAERLRLYPEYKGNSGTTIWCKDTQAQFEKNLREINEPYDVIDVHTYNKANGNGIVRFTGETYSGCPNVPTNPIGQAIPFNVDFIRYLISYSQSLGKKLYIGEFGDTWDNPENGHNQFHFTKNILNLMNPNSFNSASIWALEFYQFNTYNMQRMNLDYSNPLASDIFDTVALKGKGIHRYSPQTELLISYPFNNGKYKKNKDLVINALVDRSLASVTKVDFYLDNSLKKTLQNSWPYQITLSAPFTKGIKTIKVVATDSSNKSVTSTIQIEIID